MAQLISLNLYPLFLKVLCQNINSFCNDTAAFPLSASKITNAVFPLSQFMANLPVTVRLLGGGLACNNAWHISECSSYPWSSETSLGIYSTAHMGGADGLGAKFSCLDSAETSVGLST